VGGGAPPPPPSRPPPAPPARQTPLRKAVGLDDLQFTTSLARARPIEEAGIAVQVRACGRARWRAGAGRARAGRGQGGGRARDRAGAEGAAGVDQAKALYLST
jgi:hypothetical protein